MTSQKERGFIMINQYANVVVPDIRTITNEEWRTLRRNVGKEPKIGCSETALVAGIYNQSPEPFPWKTPVAFARELRAAIDGVIYDNISSTAMEWGHKMETPIAIEWAKRNPDWQLVATHTMYESKAYPWMRGNFDFLCQNKKSGELRILEIKHTHARNEKFVTAMKEGRVPDYYAWQCQAEMTITGIQSMFICLGWTYMDDNAADLIDIAWVELHSNAEKEAFMVKETRSFLQKVEKGEEIKVKTSEKLAEELKELWGEYKIGTTVLDAPKKDLLVKYRAILDEEEELSDRLKNVRVERDVLADQIFQAAERHCKAEYADEKTRYIFEMTFKSSNTAREEDIKVAYPKIYDASQKFSAEAFKKEMRDHGFTKAEIDIFFDSIKTPNGFSLKTASTFKD